MLNYTNKINIYTTYKLFKSTHIEPPDKHRKIESLINLVSLLQGSSSRDYKTSLSMCMFTS